MTWPFSFTAKTDGVDDHLAAHVNAMQNATDALANSWIPITDTWAYASASTITVPTDYTARFEKGVRIRFKQGGAYKYFAVITVAATLLTVAVNTDYTVASATITDIYYSFDPLPIGYPGLFTFTPTIVGFSGSPPVPICRYFILGNLMHFVYSQATVATSTTTGYTVTMPVTAKNVANYFQFDSIPDCRNNGVIEAAGVVYATPASATLTLLRSAQAAWTNSGNKLASFTIDVEYQ